MPLLPSANSVSRALKPGLEQHGAGGPGFRLHPLFETENRVAGDILEHSHYSQAAHTEVSDSTGSPPVDQPSGCLLHPAPH